METDEVSKVPEKVSVEKILKQSTTAAEGIVTTIRGYSTLIVGAFLDTAAEALLSRVTAEFGLRISGEGNIYVVKSTAEASVKITAEWIRNA